MNKPNYNLSILGLAAILIATLTTVISVLIYHYSGDIYLDRSRPGFLPDKVEAEAADNAKKESYSFSENIELNRDNIDRYIKEYQEELDSLDKLNSAFSSGSLSDESLGIPDKDFTGQSTGDPNEQPEPGLTE